MAVVASFVFLARRVSALLLVKLRLAVLAGWIACDAVDHPELSSAEVITSETVHPHVTPH